MTTIITTILPFVIIAFLFGIFIFMLKVGKKFATPKVTHWILFIYIGVLLLSTAFVPFITDDMLSLKEMEQVDSDEALNDFYMKLSKGKLDKIDDHYLMNESTFGVDQIKTLEVKSSNEDGLQVFVERKTSDNPQIETFIFGNRLTLDGYDFTQKLKPYHLELTDQILDIIPPKQQDIKIAIASKDFSIRQFLGESINNHSFGGGNQVVYLRIPHDLELIAGDHVFLEFIER